MLSQLMTLSRSKPLAMPTPISVDNPRTDVVIGATVTVVRNGRTNSRVRITTGLRLSRLAVWIGRISQGPVVFGERIRQGVQDRLVSWTQPVVPHLGPRIDDEAHVTMLWSPPRRGFLPAHCGRVRRRTQRVLREAEQLSDWTCRQRYHFATSVVAKWDAFRRAGSRAVSGRCGWTRLMTPPERHVGIPVANEGRRLWRPERMVPRWPSDRPDLRDSW